MATAKTAPDSGAAASPGAAPAAAPVAEKSVGEVAAILSQRKADAAKPPAPVAKPAAAVAKPKAATPKPKPQPAAAGGDDDEPADDETPSPEGDEGTDDGAPPPEGDESETDDGAPPEGDEAEEGDDEPAGDDDSATEGEERELSIRVLPKERLAEKFTIKADGQTVDVSLRDLFRGYARNESYTKGMQGLATERKAVVTERKQYAVMLKTLGERLNRDAQAEQARLAELAETDPVAYLQLKDQLRERKELADAAESEQNRLREVEEAEQRQAFEQHVAGELKKLARAFPKLGLDKVDNRRAFGAKLFEGMQREYGFSRKDIQGIHDHRAYMVLHDALKYRELRRQGQAVRGKIAAAPVPKPAAPSAPRSAPAVTGARVELNKLTSKLKQSGKVADAAALIAAKSRLARG